MLLPTKPKNYPLIFIHASLFAVRNWYGKKELSNPWLKWFTWEITNLADLIILGDDKVGEDFLDKERMYFTHYITEEEMRLMGGPKKFIEWMQYGLHPVHIIVPKTEEYERIPNAIFIEDSGFESVKGHLFELIHLLRKL